MYDNASRLLSIVHSNSAGQFAQFDYALNNVGNRTGKTQTDLVDLTNSLVRAESYSYDAVDQLTRVAYATNAVTIRTVNYDFDPVGNRTNVTEEAGLGPQTTTYVANNLNHYTQVGADTPSYDGNGNLTGINGWTYSYDAQNRLISAVGGPSSVTAAFSYDPRNRCVARTINGTTTHLTYDGWSLIEERNQDASLHAKYVHGAVIDEILMRLSSPLPFTPFYYHHDGLGSTTHLMDGNGVVVESYAYDVYGAPMFFDGSGLQQQTSGVQSRFLFTGREWLAPLGLHDCRHRFYSESMGRFLQKDPIGFRSRDVNGYRYVLGNPARWTDPSGLITGGEVLCDGQGQPEVLIYSNVTNPSLRKCVKEHEDRHVQDIISRYGKDVCKDKPRGYIPGSEDPDYKRFRCATECNAYQVSVTCLEAELTTCPAKQRPGLELIRDSWKRHANAECRKAALPEPYK